MNGAAGENRTHDLSLTKGLRYHYATAATGPEKVFEGVARYNLTIAPRPAQESTDPMAKLPPERRARALRANLKRRKSGAPTQMTTGPAKDPEKLTENPPWATRPRPRETPPR